MTRIFLIGYMGAGKTTLGKAFARALGLTFVDLDWYIEERFHKSIRQLFAERGEEGFRELEKRRDFALAFEVYLRYNVSILCFCFTIFHYA